MKKITVEYAQENKLSYADVIRFYKPSATDEECNFILWEKTCFPMSAEDTINQIFDLFKNSENTEGVSDAVDESGVSHGVREWNAARPSADTDSRASVGGTLENRTDDQEFDDWDEDVLNSQELYGDDDARWEDVR